MTTGSVNRRRKALVQSKTSDRKREGGVIPTQKRKGEEEIRAKGKEVKIRTS